MCTLMITQKSLNRALSSLLLIKKSPHFIKIIALVHFYTCMPTVVYSCILDKTRYLLTCKCLQFPYIFVFKAFFEFKSYYKYVVSII